MFKWEKYGKSTNSQKELRLTFKKRLYVGPYRIPENPVEFDLLFHQVRLARSACPSFVVFSCFSSALCLFIRVSLHLWPSHIKCLDDVRSDRFPIAPEESAFLVALRAQVEHGNFDPQQPAATQYTTAMDKYLPKHLRTVVSPEDIGAHHMKLRDLGKQVSASYPAPYARNATSAS
jgi:hypothetical protein